VTLLAPIGLAALLLGAAIVILHMLTPRRPPTQVSSLLHWDGLKHSITAAEPWQKLRWSLLLVLQLLAVLLFALALSQPARVETAVLADHTVFVIDASGSMSAIDGSPDRLADAVERAGELHAEIPQGGAASVVMASSNPLVLLQESTDADEFRRAIASIRTSSGNADYEAAFALAESLVSAERPTGFVLISDGGLDETEQKLAPLGTRFEPVGKTDTNRALTDLSVSTGPAGLVARVTIESTGGPDATQVVRLDVDGVTVDRREVTIPAGQVVEETFELPQGQRVAAYLDGEDLVAFDNQRFVAAPLPGSLKVRVHGEGAFFIEQLLLAIPDVDFEVARGEAVDFEVYAGTAVPLDPATPFIAVDAPGGAPGITPSGRIEDPIPTLVTDDPLLEDVDVSRIAIADAQVVAVESGEVLLAAPGAPLIVRGQANGVPFFYITFTLEQSNLPVNVAFPIVASRMVGELASADGAVESLTVGDQVPVGSKGGEVVDPRGNRQLVSIGESEPRSDQAGFWVLEREDQELVVIAVNADTTESHLAPVRALSGLRPAEVAAGDGINTAEVARSLLPWVIAGLLVVLAIEYWVSRRARGVSNRQWKWGTALRLVIVGLLVLTLVDPIINLSNDSVTTVFVVDVSDSIGASVDEARSWVQAAITDADDGRWAVVEAGGDARVAAPLGVFPYSDRARVVDVTATNLARGLRLGESLLTGETKQRIVLVSDGRPNSGDLSAEIDRLKALGVVVDVHTVEAAVTTDAAVASIDVPNEVNEGETFSATVEVLSSVTAEGEIELLNDGEVVGSLAATLQPGSNLFTFPVDAGGPGLQELTARVEVSGDSTRQNDSTTTAVQVLGPASVLIIEGEDEEGRIIGDVLESRGLVVETIDLDALPGIQDLSAHRAVVMIDVSARDISESDLQVLDTFVRDLGRGLVVIGGEDSYALGGYQNTGLEALLPVDSEAQDAKREATVAEVLLIDTSESMGACHCSDEGEFMESSEGGVNKTDISKAAAIRAVEVLSENDEVGVLAFSGGQKWVVPLQALPSSDVIDDGVGGLRPFGETRIIPALKEAAEALRSSDKELKHIILFSDGFTSELNIEGFSDPNMGAGDLVEEARSLAEEGITVSVVGTGEGAIHALEEVAVAGNGRFYPGRDLNEIPEIFVKEARLASRSFINEGEFYPSVTSTSAAVRELASSPALLGYLATTAKPIADVQLQVGEFADPLLASWRVGLGQVTAWTSDGGDKWAAQWAGWDGYADFWSNVVRETFPLTGSTGQRVDASIADETMTITLESADAWPAGTSPVARVGYPDGTSEEVRLERTSDFEFAGVASARQGGAYAVGVGIENAEGETVIMSAIASRSFAAEYLPGEADPDLMRSVSLTTGGRGEIGASDAFESESLAEGSSAVSLRWWFLLFAALLWPIDVALRRLRLSRRERSDPPARSEPPRPTPTSPEAAQTH